jgi:methylenetetrahydrofolate dehydrogenase (NADP+)/methenyltetrahydrofolate cyclohydrolase
MVITCAPNFETQKYLALKKRRAREVGIALSLIEFQADATTAMLVDAVTVAARTSSGVVVQLPLPAHIDREAVLAAIPVTHDPDGFWYGSHGSACVPPVVEAIAEILRRYEVPCAEAQVVVLGAGRLVGRPAVAYMQAAGAHVSLFTEPSVAQQEALKTADIIISGIGVSHYITPDMVKSGVVVCDAGTSEDGGILVGDVDPAVAEKAALFTPVPGGIGPITIAALLSNLVKLAVRQ